MAKNVNISGVGGWLAILVVGLTIIGPLWGFSELSTYFRKSVEEFPRLASNARWQNYEHASWLIFTASAVISFAGGLRLWKTHLPESVRFAIIALWLAGPLANVLYIVSAIIIFGGNVNGHFIAQMVGGIISSVIGASIWTAYLMRSVRVRNTYKLPHSD